MILLYGEFSMYNTVIKSVSDVRDFFIYLIDVESLNFHPDTPFGDYINTGSGQSCFTDKQAREYDQLMATAVTVCEKADVSVYDISLSLLQSWLKLPA